MRIRKLIFEIHAQVLSGGAAVAIALRWFEDSRQGALVGIGMLVLLLAVLGWHLLARIRAPSGSGLTRPWQDDLRLGLLGLAVLHVLFRLTGGIDSPVYPLLFLFIAGISLLADRWALWVIVGLALVAEALPFVAGTPADRIGSALLHGLFIGLFSMGYAAMLRGQVRVLRWRQQSVLDGELRRIEEEARSFRLHSLGPEQAINPARADALALQVQDGVKGIRRAVRLQLTMLRDAFGLHSCVLYWREGSGKQLRVLEASSGSDRLSGQLVAVGEGIPGTVASTGEPVRLQGLRTSSRGLLHYQPGEQVAVLLAVPIRDRGEVSGVLLGDRRHDLPFTVANQAVFEQAADWIASAMQNERVFLATERQKADQEIFHQALKSLNGALEAEAVFAAVLRAAAEVAPYQLAVLTLFDSERHQHRVVQVVGSESECARLDNQAFTGRGLVAQVVKTNHHLPVGCAVGERPPIVFDEDEPLTGYRSLLVLPLPYGPEEVLGTLVLAAQEPGVFDREVLERLEVIASSAAVSIKNAEQYELIRAMATTDGLTNLVNHRTFQVRYEEALNRARRMGTPLGVLLMDIDHFKVVNDTHGHPAGDEVLRSVARRLSRTVREIDLVARYGGEEFVVLLEGATVDGAITMGERLREAVAAEQIPVGATALSVTISVGVACYPPHGETRELILERADQALYSAKKGGRNQVRVFEQRVPSLVPRNRNT